MFSMGVPPTLLCRHRPGLQQPHSHALLSGGGPAVPTGPCPWVPVNADESVPGPPFGIPRARVWSRDSLLSGCVLRPLVVGLGTRTRCTGRTSLPPASVLRVPPLAGDTPGALTATLCSSSQMSQLHQGAWASAAALGTPTRTNGSAERRLGRKGGGVPGSVGSRSDCVQRPPNEVLMQKTVSLKISLAQSNEQLH